MTDCKIAQLESRGVVEVGGADARHFLQGLLTTDVNRAKDGSAVHAALLTPQGKILFDFLLAGHGDGFLLDCRRDVIADLVKRLTFYKLRAKVEIADRSGDFFVCAAWGGKPQAGDANASFDDPRLQGLGHRLVLPNGTDISSFGCAVVPEPDYHAHRIALGVPEGGVDFAFGDAFPHEADYDQLGGVDFAKGCFVGQEVVSRMEHRGTARKRIVPAEGAGALMAGAEITADGSAVGSLGSVAGNAALAMVRLDRAEKALEQGKTLEAGGVAVTLLQPGWAKFNVPGSKGSAT
jgi:folate-binding protein YgfZ